MSPALAEGRWLRAAVLAVVVVGLAGPIAAGLLQTARAAAGVMPAIGADSPGVEALQALTQTPGLAQSLRSTLVTGFGATLLSLTLALGLALTLQGRPGGVAGRLLAPLLAAPHAALAIGLAFLLAPSGWIARGLAPLAGWDRPPDLVTVGDPAGLALILGLAVKEVPFLLLMIGAALGQIDARGDIAAARALGYGRGTVRLKIVLPQLWPLIRLPVMVVLAFSLSVVDMALILGPSNPPTLAVLLTRMFADPDLRQLLPASAGAMLQLGLVLGAFAALWLAERTVRWAGLGWLRRGGRRTPAAAVLRLAAASGTSVFLLGLAALLAMAIWSLAWRWPWPAPLPVAWSGRAWAQGGWGDALLNSLGLAALTTAAALALAVAWLEGEDRARRGRAGWAEALIYLPLLVPQIGFLYGLNLTFLRVGLDDHLLAVAWAQALFVFPYVMIALSGPWRALDPRLSRSAAALGAGSWRRLFAVKLPVLLAPLLTAAAVGVAVSVAQYLPTLFMGAGRVATLTTEAVTLSSGADRRVTGVYATLQAGLPLAAFLVARAVPAILHRERRALRGGGS